VFALAQGDAGAVTPTPEPTPFVIGLSSDPPHPRVGDLVTLTFDVDVFGSPQFKLEGATPLLTFESPSITEAQSPGRVSYTLRAAAVGRASLRLNATYEFVDCSCGCTIERQGMTSEPFPLEIGPASSNTAPVEITDASSGNSGAGCAIDPQSGRGSFAVALLILPVGLWLSRAKQRHS
jgi:hypothetical protein